MANYTGVLQWFDNDRGYGFICANDGNDVFVHYSKKMDMIRIYTKVKKYHLM